jgi:predicted kinase
MSELRVLIGLPASGKTTYAKSLGWTRINWDTDRKCLGLFWKKFDRKTEDEMQKNSFQLVESLGRSEDIVIDNTNLSEKTRNKWKGVAERAGMTYTEKRFDTPVEICVDRDSKRIGTEHVGRAVIERMALFADRIKFDPDERIVICDIDGTLADCSHRIHHITKGKHDWDTFESLAMGDAVREPIANLVNLFYDNNYTILIVSGRMIDRAGKNTAAWLDKYKIPYQHIFMRNGGDTRQDAIVKMEILEKLPKNQICYILDDRQQVVDAWRAAGLTCLQVAPGNF